MVSLLKKPAWKSNKKSSETSGKSYPKISYVIFGIALMLKGFLPKEKLNFKNVIEKVEE